MDRGHSSPDKWVKQLTSHNPRINPMGFLPIIDIKTALIYSAKAKSAEQAKKADDKKKADSKKDSKKFDKAAKGAKNR